MRECHWCRKGLATTDRGLCDRCFAIAVRNRTVDVMDAVEVVPATTVQQMQLASPGQDFCLRCGGMLMRTGTCQTCTQCGQSGGCG